MRKIPELKCAFAELTDKNYEQLRVLNYLTLPVLYSDNFYDKLVKLQRFSKFAYVKDVLVGAISWKIDNNEENDTRDCYLMTITVLKPYRRYGIASQCLERAIKEATENH